MEQGWKHKTRNAHEFHRYGNTSTTLEVIPCIGISTVVTETWFSFGNDVRIAFAIRVCKPGHHFRSCVSLQVFQNNYNYLHSVVGCWWSIPALVSSACTVGSSNPRRCQWFQSETYKSFKLGILAKSEKLALFYHTSRHQQKGILHSVQAKNHRQVGDDRFSFDRHRPWSLYRSSCWQRPTGDFLRNGQERHAGQELKHHTFQQRDGWPNVICVACFDVIIDSFESFDDRLVINFRAGLASFASALLGSCAQDF